MTEALGEQFTLRPFSVKTKKKQDTYQDILWIRAFNYLSNKKETAWVPLSLF